MTNIKTSLRVTVVLTWLCLVAWLIRFEAFPEYFTRSLSGYRGLITREVLVSDSWMKISFRGSDLGYSHTSFDIKEDNPQEHYVIENRLHIAINMLGRRHNIHAVASVTLDSTRHLTRFSFALSAPGTVVRVNGSNTRDDTYAVNIRTEPGAQKTLSVTIPDDVVLYSPVMETAMKSLKPGQEMNMRILDPVSLKKANLVMRAVRRENLQVSGSTVAATMLASRHHGIDMATWVDANGLVLRQESSIGWTMQKCTPDEAFAAALSSRNSDDALRVLLPLILSMETQHD